ncbi:MAG: hypothetical protein Q7T74_06430 [Candidatus Saccharibacteria bacterium]|nr:hypothetical protein [Candidatus Saccharibacteria bacterium]
MNYLVYHKTSNLILRAVASAYTPKPYQGLVFIEATDKNLDQYYKLKLKSKTGNVDIGALMLASPSFAENYAQQK